MPVIRHQVDPDEIQQLTWTQSRWERLATRRVFFSINFLNFDGWREYNQQEA